MQSKADHNHLAVGEKQRLAKAWFANQVYLTVGTCNFEPILNWMKQIFRTATRSSVKTAA